MYKLLKTNFFRLVKNKIFWGIVIITILIASFILFNTILNQQGETKEGIDKILVMYIHFIGIFIAIFTSLFVGTEYSDGALRNKIVIGHSRKNIYFANMMTSIVVGICIELIYMFVIAIVGIPTLGTLQMTTEKFLFIVLDIVIMIPLYNLHDSRNFIEFLSIIVIPSISKNILFTYFILKFGYLTNICYRVIMELTIYIVPILPNINIYLDSVFKFTFPIIILMCLQKILNEKKDIEVRKPKILKIVDVFVTLFLLIVVFLTSGIFSHYALVIGSDSMNPNINKGDIVIVKKIKSEQIENIEVGDILVFNMRNKVVVHRVQKINDNNNRLSFITKGDNNIDVDNWVVNENDVIGIVTAKIPIVGYPTVWLNEMIGG